MQMVDRFASESLMGTFPYRGKFYVSLKGAMLRWIIRVGKRECHTLNSTVWRKAGLKGEPSGIVHGGAPGSTYYFLDERDADAAREAVLGALREKGVV